MTSVCISLSIYRVARPRTIEYIFIKYDVRDVGKINLLIYITREDDDDNFYFYRIETSL